MLRPLNATCTVPIECSRAVLGGRVRRQGTSLRVVSQRVAASCSPVISPRAGILQCPVALLDGREHDLLLEGAVASSKRSVISQHAALSPRPTHRSTEQEAQLGDAACGARICLTDGTVSVAKMSATSSALEPSMVARFPNVCAIGPTTAMPNGRNASDPNQS